MPSEPINFDFNIEQTVYGKLCQLTIDELKAIALPGIGHNVEFRKRPWLIDGLKLPAAIVSYDAEQIDPNNGTNETDIVDYGVIVTLAFANELDVTDKGAGIAFYWREKTRRHFQNKSFATTLPDNCFFRRSKVPGGTSLLIEQAKRQGIDAQYLLIRYEVEEPRE